MIRKRVNVKKKVTPSAPGLEEGHGKGKISILVSIMVHMI